MSLKAVKICPIIQAFGLIMRTTPIIFFLKLWKTLKIFQAPIWCNFRSIKFMFLKTKLSFVSKQLTNIFCRQQNKKEEQKASSWDKSKYCFLRSCCYTLRIDLRTQDTHQGTKDEKKKKKTIKNTWLMIFFFVFLLFEIKIWNMSKGQKWNSGQKCW